MAEGFVRILYVKTKSPRDLREAIATTNLDYVPYEQRPQGQGTAAKPHLIRYFEFLENGDPLGWRCFSKHGLIGWAEYVPVGEKQMIYPQEQ